jgi:hypothetical protein
VVLNFVFGCSSGVKPDNVSEGPKGVPVYANLVERDGKYVLESYSLTLGQVKDVPRVRVNDGMPMWDTSTEKSCLIGIMGGNTHCKTRDDALFRTFHVAVVSTGFSALLTMGIGLAAPIGDVEFDREDFKKAYKSAIKNSSNIKEEIELIDKDIHQVEEEYKRISDVYNSAKGKLDVSFQVNDKSELYDGSVDFSYFVKNDKPLIKDDDKIQSISANSLEELRDKINAVVQGEISTWRKQSETFHLTCLNKKVGSYATYRFYFTCPQSVSVQEKNILIPVTIVSKDVGPVLPRNIAMQDKVIKVFFDGDELKVINNANSYISIESVSFYYGGKIAAISNLHIELPPSSEKRIKEVNDFPVTWGILRFPRTTKQKLKGTHLTFGFAIKYAILNSNSEKTLFNTKQYKVLNLI